MALTKSTVALLNNEVSDIRPDSTFGQATGDDSRIIAG